MEINEKGTKKVTEQIKKTKNWFFEKINTISRLLARFIKKKHRRTQTKKIRNERNVATDTTEI